MEKYILYMHKFSKKCYARIVLLVFPCTLFLKIGVFQVFRKYPSILSVMYYYFCMVYFCRYLICN